MTNLSRIHPTAFCCESVTRRLRERAARASVAPGDGERFRSSAACSSRRALSGPRAGLARPRRGSQRGPTGFGRGRSRANHAAGAAALRAEARAHAALASGCRPPRWAAFRTGTFAPRRRDRPGWVLRFTGDDEEASGSAARLCRSLCFGRKSAGRDQGACAAAVAASKGSATGSAVVPLTPLSISSSPSRLSGAFDKIAPLS